jgi:hypothetical protein
MHVRRRDLLRGSSWQKVLDGTGVNGCLDLAIQTDRHLALVYAACGTLLGVGSTTAAVYRALDTGSTMTWSIALNPINLGRTSLAIAPSNQNIIYAGAASNETGNFNQGLLAVYKSTSSGAAGSWTTQVTNTSATERRREQALREVNIQQRSMEGGVALRHARPSSLSMYIASIRSCTRPCSR